MELGSVGIWSGGLAWGDQPPGEVAAAVEDAGFRALWTPGGAGGDVLERCRAALDATQSLIVATGILNIWRHDAAEVAATAAELDADSGGRFLLGLGVSHERLIKEEYVAPMAKMRSYLDDLDAAGNRPERRVLAALGPRMLELAASRSAGAHPYFVPVEHTAVARATLGQGPLLATEQMVVLETDPGRAREIARRTCATYLALPNYTNNLRRLGYDDGDLNGGGSDRLVDAIVAWGSVDAVADRVRSHLDAGADHVCLQVLGEDPRDVPVTAWRELAGAVL